MGEYPQDTANIGPPWAIPIITMVTISASGGIFAGALLSHSRSLSLLSLVLSTATLFIGLSFAMMFMTVFFMRIYLHGPLEHRTVLTTFAALTPIGQGGYSMLLNGKYLADLLPDTINKGPFVGDVLFSLCFSGAYILWCMGILWITISCFSVIRHGLFNLPPFNMSYWGLIVPNGAFSLLTIELAQAMDSSIFRVFGMVWAFMTLALWAAVFVRTASGVVDGSAVKLTALPVTKDCVEELPDPEKATLVNG
ncbi:hypothetical protein EIP86_005460 [Pleurotus ostreatoroseus]|nr:hypothetical protein EIP86_005460 [Pleurotus ostreatoroseus]